VAGFKGVGSLGGFSAEPSGVDRLDCRWCTAGWDRVTASHSGLASGAGLGLFWCDFQSGFVHFGCLRHPACWVFGSST